MKPEIKQSWIAALKSDEYKQSTGYLKTEEGFCCLGVLTDLYLQEIGDLWTAENDNGKQVYIYDECGFYLSNCVLKWAGLANVNPTVEVNGGAKELSYLNDNGFDFPSISKLIESSLTEELYPELFTY